MSATANPFVWYELMTTDTAAAQAFYRSVVGWAIADSGMPGHAGYNILSVGEISIGGLMALPAEACAMGVPPHWVGYVSVADVDASAASIQQAGGSVRVGPMDIPGVGRFATVADPHGASFVVFKGNGEASTPMPPGTPGTVGWHELMANDGDAAVAFYTQQFAWKVIDKMDMGPMGQYQMFSTGAGPDTVGGIMSKPPEVPMAFWQYYVNVPAIDAAVGRITAGGGKVTNGPMEVPGGQWVVNAQDPQGAHFSLVAPVR